MPHSNPLHPLLEKQIKQYLKDGKITPAEWKAFVNAINETYEQHDTQQEVLKRSLDLTSKELLEMYISLKEKGKSAEAPASTSTLADRALAIFRSTLVSLPDGILVVDLKKKILIANQRFTELWKIPASQVTSWTEKQTLKDVLSQLADPDVLFGTVVYLNTHPEALSHDLIHLKTRQIVECYSMPQKIGDRIIGRVWSFRDISERG